MVSRMGGTTSAARKRRSGRPVRGSAAPGQSSRSGQRKNERRASSGWGIVSSGLSRTRCSARTMSMSMMRETQAFLLAAGRPIRRSISLRRSRSASARSGVLTAAQQLRNGPAGSLISTAAVA